MTDSGIQAHPQTVSPQIVHVLPWDKTTTRSRRCEALRDGERKRAGEGGRRVAKNDPGFEQLLPLSHGPRNCVSMPNTVGWNRFEARRDSRAATMMKTEAARVP